MSLQGTKILLLDEDRFFLRGLTRTLEGAGLAVSTAPSSKDALHALRGDNVDLLLGDLSEDLLRQVRREFAYVVPIVLTGFAKLESAVRAIKAGAFDYLAKPADDDRLLDALSRAAQQRKFTSGVAPTTTPLIGNHPSIAKLLATARTVAATRATVLITGESGTGKSLLARAIHEHSPRASAPFAQLACGSLPESLLEPELFGHAKGAFTGATHDKPGRFDAADGGTFFLDEVNSASPAMQLKLLRVLQDRAFEPVGSTQTRTVDLRLILASNADLGAMAARGTFRQDLLYRINVVTLALPALRERPTDIPVLANHFLQKFAQREGRQILGFAPEATQALQRHAWPGNIRELENVVERAVVLSAAPTITIQDLPDALMPGATPPSTTAAAPAGPRESLPLFQALELPEKELIEQALQRNDWNRVQTAADLKIDRTTLYKKMRKYRIGA